MTREQVRHFSLKGEELKKDSGIDEVSCLSQICGVCVRARICVGGVQACELRVVMMGLKTQCLVSVGFSFIGLATN